MERFFQKHPIPHTEKDAIDLIHAKVHCIKAMYDNDTSKTEYLYELASIPQMILDFFEAKDLQVESYIKKEDKE